MKNLIITIDLDWACESAIEETLDFFRDKKIPLTVFSTHRSKAVETYMNDIDVGLHPFFGKNSSHGDSITEIVNHIVDLPHNLKGFRCHRFNICNLSKQAMIEAGMVISSNVCTNLDIIKPFQDRSGLLEFPIFLEDGGYLLQKHSLEINEKFKKRIENPDPKIIVIHPMHFAINTPSFNYMKNIKESINRQKWNQMSKNTLDKLRWKGHGIRNFIIELLAFSSEAISLRALYHNVSKQRDSF